jgi:hypothetical protein
MSVGVNQNESTKSAKLVPCPTSVPRLPIVQFFCDHAGFDVFYDVDAAVEAAEASAEDELYDARGIALTLGGEGSRCCLEALGRPEPFAARRRLTSLLRAAEGALGGGLSEIAVEAQLLWLEGAPSFRDLVHGLGLAPIIYSGHCVDCTYTQKLAHKVNCC